MSVNFADHIFFILLAFVLPLLAVFRVRTQVTQIPTNTKVKIRLYWLNSAVLWAGGIIVVLIWLFSGRDFSMMGWRLIDNGWFPEWVLIVWVFGLIYITDTFFAWNSVEDNPLYYLP